MSKVQPLGGRLLIKPQEAEDQTAGGLIIPDGANDSKPEMGTVVKLGTGGSEKDWGVKEGDTVYFSKYSPSEIEVDGETMFILEYKDVLAVVK
jgi:chaperonin GroES